MEHSLFVATVGVIAFIAGVFVSLLVITIKIEKMSYNAGHNMGFDTGYRIGYKFGVKRGVDK